MAFLVPEPPVYSRPSRQKVIEQNFPQATSAIKKILRSSDDIRYGSPASRFLDDYHFQSHEDVRAYFKHYLSERHGSNIDEDMINSHVALTINRRPEGVGNDSKGCNACFNLAADDMIGEIEIADDSGADIVEPSTSMLRFVVGSTGTGKTAFSKALFCVSLLKFWNKKIVPTRVEYSKISRSVGNKSSRVFFQYVRQCQLRDLLMFFIFRPQITIEEKLKALTELKLKDTSLSQSLRELILDSDRFIIDGETRTVTQIVQRKMEAIFLPLTPAQQSTLLYALNSLLDVSFLISFDGFDAVHIDDFFFEPGMTPPAVDYIALLLRRLWRRESGVGLHERPTKAHYLIYLRDTTFERLKDKLVRGVGESFDLPVNWIVPPKYEQLVRNAAANITGEFDPQKNNCNLFSEDAFTAFDDAVFQDLDGLSARNHLSFVFASNARRMKQHIVRSLIWAMHRSSQSGAATYLRKSAGVDAKWLWNELIVNQHVLRVPQYLTLEELYLNESRQLIPTLNVDYPTLSKVLAEGDFKTALDHVHDHDEVIASYGCVLNYFLPRHMYDGEKVTDLPQLLVLVRMIQFIQNNHRCRLVEVVSFVRSLGYNLNDHEARFCFYLLVRNQIIMWDSSTGAMSIEYTPLYATTKGKILVNRLLYSVSYVSEAMLDALQCNKQMIKLLKPRVFDSSLNWVVDCIHNSSLFCYMVEQIEDIEKKNMGASYFEFDKYQLSKPLRSRLHNEAKSILFVANEAALARHLSNLTLLEAAVTHFPSLVPLGANR